MHDSSDEYYEEGNKFKRAVNFVLQQREPTKKIAQIRDTIMQSVEEVKDEIVFLNLDIFRRQPKVKPGVLTDSAKSILGKPTHKRTEIDIMECMEIMKDMAFLDKFPERILAQLTSVLIYVVHNKGQEIMHQGHPGWAMYFIYNGLVAVEITITDAATKITQRITVAELGAGSQIGGISLLKNSPRSASIVCKVTTHLLVLYKEDFELILKEYIDKEYTARLWALNNLPIFSTVLWTPHNFEIIVTNSLVKYYPKNSLILGEVTESPYWTYFIISGRCKVVRLIEYVEESIRTNTVLHEYRGEELYPGQTKHRKLLQICRLHSGHYFSVGENLQTTYILAGNNVVCVLVPCILLDRYCRRGFTKKLLDDLIEELPSTQKILQLYTRRLVWERYQDRYVQETMKQKTLHMLSDNCCEEKKPQWKGL